MHLCVEVLKPRSWSGFRDLDEQDLLFFFFFFFFFLALNGPRSRSRVFFMPRTRRKARFWFFFFFFFFPTLNRCYRRIGFFFSLSVHPRLSVTTCSTLHPSDVGFFMLFRGEDLATFTSCSIFKTFVRTYLPTYLLGGMGLEWRKKKKAGAGGLCPTVTGTHYLSTCLVVLTLFAFAGHVMDGWMNECQAKCRTRV